MDQVLLEIPVVFLNLSKREKAQFILFKDRYVLLNSEREIGSFPIDYVSAEIRVELTRVPRMKIFTKTQWLFVISDNNRWSPQFYVDEDDAQNLKREFYKQKQHFIEKKTKEEENQRSELHRKVIEARTAKMTNCAKEYFLKNPFYVLGIGADSDENIILSQKDDILSYVEINMLEEYKSEYSLPYIDMQNRSLVELENAVKATEETKYRLFWVCEPKVLLRWIDENIFVELFNSGIDKIDYDIFVVALINVCILDPEFSNNEKWIGIFSCFDLLMNTGLGSLRIGNVEVSRQEAINIWKAFLENLVNNLPIYSLFNCIKILCTKKLENLEFLKKKCCADAIELFEERTTFVIQNSLPEHDLEAINSYISDVLAPVGDMIRSVDDYYDLFRPLYIDKARVLLDAIETQFGVEQSVKIINYLYPFCKNEVKAYYRRKYGFENLKIPKEDIKSEEIYERGLYYQHEIKDMFYAAMWYRQAALAGNLDAANAIGECFLNGDGVEQSDGKAFEWFRKAADGNHVKGRINIALCYLNGTHVKKDRGRAKEILMKVANEGYEYAKWLLDNLFKACEHKHIDLGFIYYDDAKWDKIVEVTINKPVYVRLLSQIEYEKFLDGENYQYRGGYAEKDNMRIFIPFSGEWHVILDSNGEELGEIKYSHKVITETHKA